MISRRTLALTVAGLLVPAAVLTTSAPAEADTASGRCTIALRHGQATISYSSQGGLFGYTTHVELTTSGSSYVLVWDHLDTPGQPTARGVTGVIRSARGFTVRTPWAPRHVSMGLVGADNGAPGRCRSL